MGARAPAFAWNGPRVAPLPLVPGLLTLLLALPLLLPAGHGLAAALAAAFGGGTDGPANPL